LLKAVAPLPRVPDEFPAHGALAEPQGLADSAWVIPAVRNAYIWHRSS
jgi:hypothetical protein